MFSNYAIQTTINFFLFFKLFDSPIERGFHCGKWQRKKRNIFRTIASLSHQRSNNLRIIPQFNSTLCDILSLSCAIWLWGRFYRFTVNFNGWITCTVTSKVQLLSSSRNPNHLTATLAQLPNHFSLG